MTTTYKASVQIGTTVYTFERKTTNYFTWAVITQDKENKKVYASFHKNWRLAEKAQAKNSSCYWLEPVKVVQAFEVKEGN